MQLELTIPFQLIPCHFKTDLQLTTTNPLLMFLQKRMQHVQNAAAGFVLNRYCLEKDEHFKTWLATYTGKHSTEHPRTWTPCSLQQLAGISDTL